VRKVTIDTGRKRYPIHIGAGLSCNTGRLASELTGPTKAALITDDKVDRLCLSGSQGLSKRAASLDPGKGSQTARVPRTMEST